MSRKLILLNVVLLGLLAFAVREIRARWLAAQAHQETVLEAKAKPAPAPAAPAADTVQPIQPGNYLEVADQLLFFKDRNPNVVIEKPEEKPVPPFPVAHGVMDFGGGPTIILSEKTDSPQKSYHKGDKIGPFLLASVDSRQVVLEWEGKQFTKEIAELKPKGEAPADAGARDPGQDSRQTGVAGASQPAQDQSVVERQMQDALRPKDGGPGLDVGGSARVCAPGENSPAGTVQGGYRKMVNRTPFGVSCRWEPIQ